MGISIDPSEPSRKRGGLPKLSAETVAKLVALDYVGAAFKAYEEIKRYRTNETLEQKAWTLWRESLSIALPEFFVSAALTRRPDDQELVRLLQDILDESKALAKKDREGLTEVHLRTPTRFPLYPPLREKLPGWARSVAPEHLRDDERLRERLDRAFERGFRRALADRDGHFAELRNHFVGDEAETGNRRDAWQRYYVGLSRKIEEEPLFNQPEDGSGATLGAIFQPLRCYWRIRAKQDQPDSGRKPDDIHIAWLQQTLEAWLEQRNGRDALRVVTGGPGSGKSSSALWFAHDAALAGSINVFVVPLQGLEVDRPIDEIVADYVRLSSSDHDMLEDSPINWLRDDPKPLLLVFDGLDEVARPDGAGLEVTKAFLRALDSRLSLANGGKGVGQARLMALALGRPAAAEDAARAMGGLSDQALLYAVPLSPLDEAMFTKDSQRAVTLHDPAELCGEDFRGAFYERYRPFDPHCDGEGTPEALRDGGLAEMTTEPLLLYLLIISGYAGKDWPKAKDNRNRVYQRIFQEIHRRDLEKPVEHPAKMDIKNQEDFFALMECLGLAAWQGGGRSGSDEDFATFRDRIYITKRGGRFKGKKSADLKNVAMQTFTHRGDGDKPGYAFIHKSFGEYLTARALVEAGDAWLARHEGEPVDFAKDWLQPAGGARLTLEILSFIIDEARLRTEGPEEARNKVKALTAIATYTLAQGFPAHGELMIADKGVVHWRGREAFQRCAEEALYALIHAWAEAGYPFDVKEDRSIERDWEPGPIKVEWTTERAAADMLARLRDQWSDGSLVNQLFQRWDLSRANLIGANLIGANLFGADLREANLSGADLFGAHLSGAHLFGADLREAHLSGADLRGADLRGADCSRMDIHSARLQSADLSEAVNLRQDQIDKADGDSETKLPDGTDGLLRPAHWPDAD